MGIDLHLATASDQEAGLCPCLKIGSALPVAQIWIGADRSCASLDDPLVFSTTQEGIRVLAPLL